MLDNFSDCNKVEPLLDAFLDNELAKEEIKLVSSHLGHCKNCQTRVAETKLLVGKVKQLPLLTLPSALDCDWDALLAKTAGNRSSKQPHVGLWPAAALVASVVLLLIVQRLLLDGAATRSATQSQSREGILINGQNCQGNSQTALSKQSSPIALGPNMRQAVREEGAKEHLASSFEDLLASDPAESSSFSEEVGISTDEDGLYALKL